MVNRVKHPIKNTVHFIMVVLFRSSKLTNYCNFIQIERVDVDIMPKDRCSAIIVNVDFYYSYLCV